MISDEFGPEFQRTLVRASINDGGLRSLLGRFVGAGQLGFSDRTAAWAWSTLQREQYPTMLVLQTEARALDPTDPIHAGVQEMLATPDYRDLDYVRQKVVQVARDHILYSALEAGATYYNQGDKVNALAAMQAKLDELKSIRLDDADREWFFEGLDERQANRFAAEASGTSRFNLGIDKIDQAMDGGLAKGELEMPLAYSNVGKSFYCTHRGFLAVRGYGRVLHFVLEGGRSKIANRYDARFSGLVTSEIKRGNFDARTLERVQREYRALRHSLVLRGIRDAKEWRVTVEDFIVEELRELRENHGWVPDMVIIDYGDLLWGPGDNDRERQKGVFRKLKTLSEREEFPGHVGYAMVVPTQAVRPDKGADEKEHILYARDVADCYEKVRIVDVAISINRTDHERQHNRIRLHLAKNRESESGVTVHCLTDYARGIFAEINIQEPGPLPPPPPRTKGKSDEQPAA